MKLHKRSIVLCLLLVIVCIMTGCNSYKAYTFSVDNGDKVKISLNTADSYDISSELPFTISQNGSVLSQGTFIQADAYSQYRDVVESDENARLIESGSKDGNEFIFWSYNSSEYNYAILIKDSNTGIILGNPISEESAKECFQRLVITLEK